MGFKGAKELLEPLWNHGIILSEDEWSDLEAIDSEENSSASGNQSSDSEMSSGDSEYSAVSDIQASTGAHLDENVSSEDDEKCNMEAHNSHAYGRKITNLTTIAQLPASMNVQGMEVSLPLPGDGVRKLRRISARACYDNGVETGDSTGICRAWEVDGSKVTFPENPEFLTKTVLQIANRAAYKLGQYPVVLKLQAKLQKLLLFEAEAHLKFHRNRVKEPGVFATLVLQLPTQSGFVGGALVFRHRGKTRTIHLSEQSSQSFYYAAFFGDCEHKMKDITQGTRLCLVFDLVRNLESWIVPVTIQNIDSFSATLPRLEEKLRPWLDDLKRGSAGAPTKLAFPLEHSYAPDRLSFSALKGNDRIVADLLRNCNSGSLNGKHYSLELHLCILTKYHKGEEAAGSTAQSSRHQETAGVRSHPAWKDGYEHHEMGEVLEQIIEADNWVNDEDESVDYDIHINLKTEVMKREDEDIFNMLQGPDEEDYRVPDGEEAATVEYWYHRALIVVWPKSRKVHMACLGNYSKALDMVAVQLERRTPEAVENLQELLDFFQTLSVQYSINIVAKVMTILLRLPDDSPLEAFVQTMLQQPKQSVLVKVVMDDILLWKEAMATRAGKKTMRALAIFRICTLEMQSKPLFCWCQPAAQFPDHPEVEAFLRGPIETFTYKGPFKNISESRQFTNDYFLDGIYRNGYSATARVGGRGKGTFCEIHKTCGAFERKMRFWQSVQEEVQTLRARIHDIEAPCMELSTLNPAR